MDSGSFGALILAQPHGDAILIGAVIGTISYDVGGYVIGSTTGQSKIAPRVSPQQDIRGTYRWNDALDCRNNARIEPIPGRIPVV